MLLDELDQSFLSSGEMKSTMQHQQQHHEVCKYLHNLLAWYLDDILMVMI